MPDADPDTSKTTSAPAPSVAAATALSTSSDDGVERRKAKFLGKQAPRLVGFDDEHPDIVSARHECDEQANRAAADHDRPLARGHLAATDIVACHRQRLGQGSEAQIERRRHRVDCERGNRP